MQDDGSYGQWGPWSSPGENVASSRGSRYPGELVNAAKCCAMLTHFLFRLSSRATRSGWMTIQTQTLMTTWGIMPMRCERGCWSFFAQCWNFYFSGRWQFWGLLIVIEFRHRWCRPWVWIPPQLWTQVCNDNLDYSVDGLIHLVSISEILVSQFCPFLHFLSQQVQETCRHVRPGVRLRRVWGLSV